MMTFEQEIETFDRLQPELQKRYGSQYVAIYQGEVIGHDQDWASLQRRMYKQFGEVHCLIIKADATEPRKVRITSIWAVREPKD